MLAFKNERADFMQSVLRRMDDARQREQDLDAEEAELREEYEELLYVDSPFNLVLADPN